LSMLGKGQIERCPILFQFDRDLKQIHTNLLSIVLSV
jgi:hypothetical protein